MYIPRSLRDGLGCVEANEGAVMVRGCNPDFRDADALKLPLTTRYRSVNAKEVCKCGKVAVCNAANHCLVRLSVCLSVNCEPDGAWRLVLLRGVHEISRDFAVAVCFGELQPTASLSKRALGKGRQGKARQLLVAIEQPPIIAASNITVAAARRHQHHPHIQRVIAPGQLNTSHCTGDNYHLLRSNLRTVAAASQHSHHARSLAPVSSP